VTDYCDEELTPLTEIEEMFIICIYGSTGRFDPRLPVFRFYDSYFWMFGRIYCFSGPPPTQKKHKH